MAYWGHSYYAGGSEIEVFLKPSEIFYSQDSVAPRFRDGRGVNDAVVKLARGLLQAEDFPTIEVVKRADGKYYSLDNRRLYVFRVGQCNGVVAKIPALVVPEQWQHQRKFTSINGGTKIRVRKDRTYRNWMDSWSAPVPHVQVRRTNPRPLTAQPQRIVQNSNSRSQYTAARELQASRPRYFAGVTRSNEAMDVISAFQALSLTPRHTSLRTTAFGSTPVENDGTGMYRRNRRQREQPVSVESTGGQRVNRQLSELDRLLLLRLYNFYER